MGTYPRLVRHPVILNLPGLTFGPGFPGRRLAIKANSESRFLTGSMLERTWLLFLVRIASRWHSARCASGSTRTVRGFQLFGSGTAESGRAWLCR